MATSSSADSIAFDGSSSDLARQLFVRAKANDSVNQLDLKAVPEAVQTRLDELRLDWDELPGLAQRALLWDSGFGFTSQNTAVQIWTLGDHSMADLALTLDEYEGAGCVPKNCSADTFTNGRCNGQQMNDAAKCVVQEFDDDISSHLPMWGIGGNPNGAPEPRLVRHAWTDGGNNNSYVVMAVHTVTLDDEPAYDVCPSSSDNEGYGSVVFPCRPTSNLTDEIKADMKVVTGTKWVSEWLKEDYATAEGESSGFNKLLLIPIIGGAVLLVLLICLGLYCKKKRREKARLEFEDTSPGIRPYLPPPPLPKSYEQKDSNARPTMAASEDFSASSYTAADHTIQLPGYNEDYASSGSNTTMKLLLTSEFLMGRRIPVESLIFLKALSKGSSGEVWLCDYAGQEVAAKRLLQTKEHKAGDVNEFAEEIELNARLQHPNIGAFIGVCWSSLNNLTMVIEYFPAGNLQRYLKKNADLLSWARDKIHMAVGVAQALEYLHGQSPPIIHRDLKSRNVLLTRQLEAKVIDFGISRGRLDMTMTGGVGTPYWTAPEILEGKRYTEQADIYSFGVVLSELDTGKTPFHDLKFPDGKKPKPFHILQEVMNGTLRPSFSEECPPRIRRVGVSCCQHDPTRRPTAASLVQMLQGE
ncbi:hypothetical protein PHYBOEH_007080 [Phytophthora boehmeriae]|uniref:Protein kinase domain-containing protein n=1 Tax=Phytophthora boehmeriae TaxID=109152 RepID=A0A8T1WA62_9STRA|nr:hypothetical protein PHYBOEH_007080 [Phytophthora boehmeriae]